MKLRFGQNREVVNIYDEAGEPHVTPAKSVTALPRTVFIPTTARRFPSYRLGECEDNLAPLINLLYLAIELDVWLSNTPPTGC